MIEKLKDFSKNLDTLYTTTYEPYRDIKIREKINEIIDVVNLLLTQNDDLK